MISWSQRQNMEDGGEEDAVFWAQEKKGRMGWKGGKKEKGKEGRKLS